MCHLVDQFQPVVCISIDHGSATCNQIIKKTCYLHGHFDWCVDHDCPCYVDDKEEPHGRCSSEYAMESGSCKTVQCGKYPHFWNSYKVKKLDADTFTDFTEEEWEEEERTEWMQGQMAKSSP